MNKINNFSSDSSGDKSTKSALSGSALDSIRNKFGTSKNPFVKFIDSLKDKHIIPQKTSPQMVLGVVVMVLTIVGGVAAFGLSKVSQDIRQQASGTMYTLGDACLNPGDIKCGANNAQLICDQGSRTWAATGRTCTGTNISSSPGPLDPSNGPFLKHCFTTNDECATFNEQNCQLPDNQKYDNSVDCRAALAQSQEDNNETPTCTQKEISDCALAGGTCEFDSSLRRGVCRDVSVGDSSITCAEYLVRENTCKFHPEITDLAICRNSFTYGGTLEQCRDLMNNPPNLSDNGTSGQNIGGQTYGTVACNGGGQPGTCENRSGRIQICSFGLWINPTSYESETVCSSLVEEEETEQVAEVPQETLVGPNAGICYCSDERGLNYECNDQTLCCGNSTFVNQQPALCSGDQETPIASVDVESGPAATSQCFFGQFSCAAIGRTASNECGNSCPIQVGVCCSIAEPAQEVIKICTPLQRTCLDDQTVQLCNSIGTAYSQVSCAEGSSCSSESGSCIVDQVAAPQATPQCYYGVSSCSLIGRSNSNECNSCPAGTASCCGDLISSQDKICTPYERSCANDVLTVCNETGTDLITQSCADGYRCDASGRTCTSIETQRADYTTCNEYRVRECDRLDLVCSDPGEGLRVRCVASTQEEDDEQDSIPSSSSAPVAIESEDFIDDTTNVSIVDADYADNLVEGACSFFGLFGVNVCDTVVVEEYGPSETLATTGRDCFVPHGEFACLTSSNCSVCNDGSWLENQDRRNCFNVGLCGEDPATTTTASSSNLTLEQVLSEGIAGLFGYWNDAVTVLVADDSTVSTTVSDVAGFSQTGPNRDPEIQRIGCGPTNIANALLRQGYTTLPNGQPITPENVVDYYYEEGLNEEYGDFYGSGGLTIEGMIAVFETSGMESEQLFSRSDEDSYISLQDYDADPDGNGKEQNLQLITEELEAGNQVVISGVFYEDGVRHVHYTTLVGVDEEGNFIGYDTAISLESENGYIQSDEANLIVYNDLDVAIIREAYVVRPAI